MDDQKIIEEEIIIPEDISDDEEIIEEDVIEPVKEVTPKQSGFEKARIKEEDRQQNLKVRYAGLYNSQSACAQLGVANADLHFNQLILAETDHLKAEKSMIELELKDEEGYLAIQADVWLQGRRDEYKEIDILLMEALADQAAGDETKMKIYLAKRSKIKGKYPKP